MENKNKDDLTAPESWETADLEDTVKRLLISDSRKSVSPVPDSDLPQHSSVHASPPPPVQSTEELINQVDQFLREALEKPRERISVLRMEQDIERFIRNPNQVQIEFNSLPTSYLRLAAHRLAQHYFLQSIAIPDPISPDGSSSRIIVRKISSHIRLPAIRLADIPVNLPQDDSSSSTPVKLAIKPRPHKGLHGNSSSSNTRSNQPKSVEERKEEYTRARARIFNDNNKTSISNNNNNNSSTVVKAREEVKLPESLDNWIETSGDEGSSELNFESSRWDNNNNNNRNNNNIINNEGGLARTRSGNRVAIFRDREVDRKDPDYDRSYDRYAQRFDPGFGFNNGSYTMQPLYAPAVNYQTEFPQLGSGPRPPPQLSLDPHHQVAHMQMGGPWVGPAAPHQQMAMAYRGPPPPESMMVHAFNAASPMGSGAGGPGVRAPIYMHSPHYAMQARPGMPVPFVSSHEHMHQSFVQAQQQQEGSYGMARPR